MKAIIVTAAAVFCLLCMSSCSRGEKPEEESVSAPGVQEYGGVMGTALKKAAALEDVLSIRHAIASFHAEEGRYPSSLEELVQKKYIPALPEAPQGMDLHYEPSTGKFDIK